MSHFATAGSMRPKFNSELCRRQNASKARSVTEVSITLSSPSATHFPTSTVVTPKSFATRHKLNTRNDILIGIGFFTPLSQCFSRFHFPLPRFPELPMHPLHDTFRDSQRSIASLKPCFTVLPLDHPRFVGENTPDCSFA